MIRKVSFRTNAQLPSYTSQATVVNIDDEADKNREYRSILWTGNHLQVTLMSIPTGSEIGAEMHSENDQFIKIESGRARVLFGTSNTDFNYERIIDDEYAIIIPAGTWHNVVNIGNEPLKLFSIYAPPIHKS